VYEVYARDSEADNALVRRLVNLLGRGPAGLVTDIDGTISPIAARPEHAGVLAPARGALAGLRDHLEVVAVITGRSVADARRMLNLDNIVYIGNHGMERLVNGQTEVVEEARPWVPRIAAVLDEVARRLDPVLKPGVIIENKGVTVSLHYRLAAHPDAARKALLDIVASCALATGLVIEEGRRVINLLPPVTVNKGSAVRWLVAQHQLEAIAYFGDDITDTHAFIALVQLRRIDGLRTLSVGVVGPESAPMIGELSDASVPSVAAVSGTLCALLDGLKASDTMKPSPGALGVIESNGPRCARS
jgi:trehalose 6-phosphate phosphatase